MSVQGDMILIEGLILRTLIDHLESSGIISKRALSQELEKMGNFINDENQKEYLLLWIETLRGKSKPNVIEFPGTGPKKPKKYGLFAPITFSQPCVCRDFCGPSA